MTITTKRLRAVLAAIALLTVAGCGGGDDDDKDASRTTEQSAEAEAEANETTEDSDAALEIDADDTESSAASGDPCGLVTSAEAEEILGRPVGEGLAQEVEGASLCAYGDGSFRVGLLGDEIPKDEWEAAEREQDGLEEVFGLGELAFFDPRNQVLDVFAHGVWIQGGLDVGDSGIDSKSLLTEVLRIALERV